MSLPDIYVVGLGSVSALGASSEAVAQAYREPTTHVRWLDLEGTSVPVARLSELAEAQLAEHVRPRKRRLQSRVASIASFAASEAIRASRWQPDGPRVAVLVGSSRGATDVLEREHGAFVAGNRVHSHTSPTTTLGNLSSVVAAELGSVSLGAELSSACSTSMQAIALGVAWLKAGFGRRCLVGGAEAPLTGFTVAQMNAVGLLARDRALDPPCQPCAEAGGTGLALGEGGCVVALEKLDTGEAARYPRALMLSGIGTSVECTRSSTGITPDGDGFYEAMSAAMAMHGEKVDCVVMHAPGTEKGDRAELRALQRLFFEQMPPLVSNKWKLGHTFGAAGTLNVELAWHLLHGGNIALPGYASALREPTEAVNSVLVNAAGFGGATVSLVLRRRS